MTWWASIVHVYTELHTALTHFLILITPPLPPPWFSWIVGGASVLTSRLLSRKIRFGWRVQLFNQIGWTWIALATLQYGILVSTVCFAYIAIDGYKYWTNKGECDCGCDCAKEQEVA